MMKFFVGPIFTSKHRMYTCSCACVIIISILGVSEGVMYDNTDSRDSLDHQTASDFTKLWTTFILPRLEEDLNIKQSNSAVEDENNLPASAPFETYDNTEDSNFSSKIRRKRLGVAGLENLDILTKTLDRVRHRNRFQLPMSVSGMNSNRLRMLMASAGKRK